MTELLDRAVDALRRRPPEMQNRVAAVMLELLDEEGSGPIEFHDAELKALCLDGLNSGPGRFCGIEEIKLEARRRAAGSGLSSRT